MICPPLRSAFILLIHYFQEVNNNAHKCKNIAIFELTWENVLPDLHVGGSNGRRPGEVWKNTSVLHRFRPEKGGAVSWWCSVISWAGILAVRFYRPFTLLIFKHCSKHSTSMRERHLAVNSLVNWCHRVSACRRRLIENLSRSCHVTAHHLRGPDLLSQLRWLSNDFVANGIVAGKVIDFYHFIASKRHRFAMLTIPTQGG